MKEGINTPIIDWFKTVYSEVRRLDECHICRKTFSNEDIVTPLSCGKYHYFHSACIEEWSKTHSDCPLCKKPIASAEASKEKKRSRNARRKAKR